MGGRAGGPQTPFDDQVRRWSGNPSTPPVIEEFCGTVRSRRGQSIPPVPHKPQGSTPPLEWFPTHLPVIAGEVGGVGEGSGTMM